MGEGASTEKPGREKNRFEAEEGRPSLKAKHRKGDLRKLLLVVVKGRRKSRKVGKKGIT